MFVILAVIDTAAKPPEDKLHFGHQLISQSIIDPVSLYFAAIV